MWVPPPRSLPAVLAWMPPQAAGIKVLLLALCSSALTLPFNKENASRTTTLELAAVSACKPLFIDTKPKCLLHIWHGCVFSLLR